MKFCECCGLLFLRLILTFSLLHLMPCKAYKIKVPYDDLSRGVFTWRFPFDLKTGPLHTAGGVLNHLVLSEN